MSVLPYASLGSKGAIHSFSELQCSTLRSEPTLPPSTPMAQVNVENVEGWNHQLHFALMGMAKLLVGGEQLAQILGLMEQASLTDTCKAFENLIGNLENSGDLFYPKGLYALEAVRTPELLAKRPIRDVPNLGPDNTCMRPRKIMVITDSVLCMGKKGDAVNKWVERSNQVGQKQWMYNDAGFAYDIQPGADLPVLLNQIKLAVNHSITERLTSDGQPCADQSNNPEAFNNLIVCMSMQNDVMHPQATKCTDQNRRDARNFARYTSRLPKWNLCADRTRKVRNVVLS